MLLLNGQPVPITIFPDKTSQCWKIPEEIFKKSHARVEWRFEHEGEFMHLAQLKYLLDSYELTTTLHLPYLPYGRQDKQVSNTTTFALLSFAHLLNSLEFIEVTCTDPHSLVAEARIESFRAVYPRLHLHDALKEVQADLVCYPDNGALNKYTVAYEFLHYIYGEKVRDQLTGKILSYKLTGDPSGKNVLIVDDICDFGRTFILLTKDLLAAGAKEVNLFVSHGLFSGGLQVLKDAGIKRIFTKEGEQK